MHINKYERYFMIVSFAMLIVAGLALIISVVGHHASLPEPAGRVDPEEVRTTAPFDDPGLHMTGADTADLVLIGQAWQWTPEEVTVPAGTEVTIIATSIDVVHGIRIPDTNANVMVIPGQISEIDVTFDEPGMYSLLCHEYCGIGHHNMYMNIRVEE